MWVQHPEKVPLGSGRACKKRKNVKVWNGQLQLTVSRTKAIFGCQFHVGAVTTYRTFSQKYGRFQARIKARGTRETGLQEAFWLWPDDRYNKERHYPASGEIDISETYSQFPDLSVPYLHYGRPTERRPSAPRRTARPSEASGTSTRCCGARSGSRSRSTARRCLVNTSGTGPSRSATSSPERAERGSGQRGVLRRRRYPRRCGWTGSGCGDSPPRGRSEAMRAVTCENGALEVAEVADPIARARPGGARGAGLRDLRIRPARPPPLRRHGRGRRGQRLRRVHALRPVGRDGARVLRRGGRPRPADHAAAQARHPRGVAADGAGRRPGAPDRPLRARARWVRRAGAHPGGAHPAGAQRAARAGGGADRADGGGAARRTPR